MPGNSNVSISESLHALNDIVGDGKSDPWGRWARLSCELSPSFRTVTLVPTATQYQRRFDKGECRPGWVRSVDEPIVASNPTEPACRPSLIGRQRAIPAHPTG